MNKLCSFFIISLFLISCEKTEAIEEVQKENPIEIPVEETPTTVINTGDVTDISVYNSKPYFQDNAGYTGSDFINLPSDRNITFVHIDGKSDTEELEKIIDELTSKGGGNITIKTGKYAFRDVLLKSNVHITIESGTEIRLEKQNEGKNAKNGWRYFFSLSGKEVGKPLENVTIIGLGSPTTRPKLIVEKFYETWGNTFCRAISLGYVKNALIENFSIVDDYTLGAAIAFNPVDINEDGETAQIAENVTIANVSLTKGSIGYGLVQTNVGKNILLKNLSSQGGMTCRIEAHTGRQYDLGLDNIVIKNVASIHGKAAVLLQPHSVLNGRILVDMAKSEGSSWTLFIKEGFVGSDSKRRAKGSFASTSKFTNISMVSTDDTATLSYKNYSFIPSNLKPLYKEPNFVYIPEDSNHKIDNGTPGKESPIVGPSVAVIYIDASYSLLLPEEKDLIISGQTENRLKIFKR
ncbi:hypothetical protein [Polaribacter sp. Q13]|uniref:hypothetical protein n=1 Tax=Polaribacter sp. Q13 TaxID=2806551 RepID=UPI00193C60C3|nr:hypothetical protein [Polaribacter sp. Q13]QVY66290.1 hypothetical protein JOP69_03055 [Polaribacter sp. Q13]